MDESAMINVFDMLVERLGGVESAMSVVQRGRCFDADRAAAGSELDGDALGWAGENVVIRKFYSGPLIDGDIYAVRLPDVCMVDDVFVGTPWVHGKKPWIDEALFGLLGCDTKAALKLRLRQRLDELDTLERSGVSVTWDIRAHQVADGPLLDGLSAKSGDEDFDVTLLRTALHQRSRGAIVDVDGDLGCIFVVLASAAGGLPRPPRLMTRLASTYTGSNRICAASPSTPWGA